MAPERKAPVAASQIHQGFEKGLEWRERNCDIVQTAPEMKKSRIGSRRMYRLRVITPMSKRRIRPARVEAVRLLVNCHTVRKEKGTMAQPSRVQLRRSSINLHQNEKI